MGDLISRSLFRKKIVDMMRAYPISCQVLRELDAFPAVEAVPVVHGEWIGNTCSACNLDWDENMVCNADDWGYFKPMPNFCPNCGADMRKKVQDGNV